MEKIEISESQIRQRPSQIAHKKQTGLQIILPIIITCIIMVAAILLIMVTSANDFSFSYRYANISIILMILPTFIMALLLGIVVVGIGIGIIKIQEIIPKYAALAEYYLKLVTQKLQEVQDGAVEPVMIGKLMLFRISNFLQKLKALFKQNSEN